MPEQKISQTYRRNPTQTVGWLRVCGGKWIPERGLMLAAFQELHWKCYIFYFSLIHPPSQRLSCSLEWVSDFLRFPECRLSCVRRWMWRWRKGWCERKIRVFSECSCPCLNVPLDVLALFQLFLFWCCAVMWLHHVHPVAFNAPRKWPRTLLFLPGGLHCDSASAVIGCSISFNQVNYYLLSRCLCVLGRESSDNPDF